MEKTKVGIIKKNVLDTGRFDKLNLKVNQPIFISEGNITHIKSSHPEDYEKYFPSLSEILNNPDYVGLHPNKKSVEYFKVFEDEGERVLVAIRATRAGTLFVKSLYRITEEKFESYITSNTVEKIKKV